MAMNVNQITAQLARLPDQALRSVAQMHKSDPYIMALVAGESARRKELRTAATPQAPGMQPTVADQLIASLPEDQGIARLPMQTEFAAEGGIVGYADGGVARYNGRTESAVQSDVPSDLMYTDLGIPLIAPPSPPSPPPAKKSDFVPTPEQVAESQKSDREAAAEALRMFPLTSRAGVGVGAIPKPTNFYAPENVAKVMEGVPKRDTVGGLAGLKEQQTAHMDEVAASRRRYEASLPKDEAGAEAMARYKKEAEAEPARRKDAFYMALLEAGLGMMGSRSQYALQGIAEGAMKGVGSYKNAMKDLDSLADTRNKAMDAINQTRRAEKQGRAEKALAFDTEQANLMAKYGMDTWKFLQEQAGLERQEAFMFALKSLDEAGANQRAYQQMLLQVRLHGDRKPSENERMMETILRLKAAGRPEAAAEIIETMQSIASGKQSPMTQRKLVEASIANRMKSDMAYAAELQKPGRYEAEVRARLAQAGAVPAAPAVPGITVEAARYTNP